MKKIEVEFIDVSTEVRPVVLGSTNLLEDGTLASEEEVVEMFDELFEKEANDLP